MMETMIAQETEQRQAPVVGDIFVGYEWGIDFFCGDELIQTVTFADEAIFNDAFDHPQWPEGSTNMESWKRPLYRAPIYGVDYGPGSVKRRFGGGYVPRGAYQRRNF